MGKRGGRSGRRQVLETSRSGSTGPRKEKKVDLSIDGTIMTDGKFRINTTQHNFSVRSFLVLCPLSLPTLLLPVLREGQRATSLIL